MLGHRNGQFSLIPSLTGSILEPCEGDTGYKKEEDQSVFKLRGATSIYV